MRRASTRVPAAILTLGLFLATGIGVPVSHDADHHGQDVHLTADGHGHGHGATLLLRDVRSERPAPSLELPTAVPVEHRSFAAELVAATTCSAPVLERGRSPPSGIRPRAPPQAS